MLFDEGHDDGTLFIPYAVLLANFSLYPLFSPFLLLLSPGYSLMQLQEEKERLFHENRTSLDELTRAKDHDIHNLQSRLQQSLQQLEEKDKVCIHVCVCIYIDVKLGGNQIVHAMHSCVYVYTQTLIKLGGNQIVHAMYSYVCVYTQTLIKLGGNQIVHADY